MQGSRRRIGGAGSSCTSPILTWRETRPTEIRGARPEASQARTTWLSAPDYGCRAPIGADRLIGPAPASCGSVPASSFRSTERPRSACTGTKMSPGVSMSHGSVPSPTGGWTSSSFHPSRHICPAGSVRVRPPAAESGGTDRNHRNARLSGGGVHQSCRSTGDDHAEPHTTAILAGGSSSACAGMPESGVGYGASVDAFHLIQTDFTLTNSWMPKRESSRP